MTLNPCFIIPSYNHSDVIAHIIASIESYNFPCIIVDDGSDLVTQTRLGEIASTHQFVTIIRHQENAGKGAAVMTGLQEAKHLGYTHAIQIDADGQHDLTTLPALITSAQENPLALISGKPVYDESISKGRLYGRYVTHIWVWIETLSFKIEDTMCGYRIYPLNSTCKLIDDVQLGTRMDFDIEIMVRLYWRNIPIIFVPTKVTYRQDNISHFKIFRDNAIISWMHTKLFIGMLWRAPLLIKKRLFAKNKVATHWSNTQERGSSWAIQLLFALYKLAGLWILNIVLYPVVVYFFITGAKSRKASLTFLRRVYDYDKEVNYFSKRPGILTSFVHFMEFAQAIRDKVLSWLGHINMQHLNFEDNDNFLDFVQSKHGAVVIGSHLGNLEVSRALSQYRSELRLNVLVLTQHANNINKLFKAVNPKFEVRLIQVRDIGPDTIMALKDKIQQGELVFIVGDRTSSSAFGRVNYVEFLGKEAPFSQGPLILASLLQSPIYLMFCMRNRDNDTYELKVEHFADKLELPRKQRQQIFQETLTRYAKRLEYHALRHPLQWFNYFDFWQKDDPKHVQKIESKQTVE